MSDTTTDSTTAPPRRKGVRRALWGAGVLLGLSAVAYLATPPVARHYAQKYLGEVLGREVSIERVLINPFRLTAEVGGLRVMDAEGTGEALAFDALRANLEIESVVRKGIVLHELALEAPRVKLVLDEGGKHNWSDVVERIQALGGDAPAEDAPPTLFSVGNIRISDGHVEVEDKPRGLKHELSAIGLGVPFISNLPVRVDVFVQPSLNATLNGDPLLLNARTKPFAESQETIVYIALKQFDLAPWMAYLPIEPRFKLPSALLTTNLEVSFSQPTDAPPVVAVRGPLQIDQLVLQDRAGAPVATVAELELEFADVQPLIGRWHFTRLRLDKPEVDLVMLKDGGPQRPRSGAAAREAGGCEGAGAEGRGSAAKPGRGGRRSAQAPADAGADAAPSATPSPANPDFLLALTRIRDGVIRFEDRSLAEPFRARIEADQPRHARSRQCGRAAGRDPPRLRERRRREVRPRGRAAPVALPVLRQPELRDHQARALRALSWRQALPGGTISDGALTGALQYRITLGDKGEPRVELGAETLALRDFALLLKGAKAPAIKVPEPRRAFGERRSRPGATSASVGSTSRALRFRRCDSRTAASTSSRRSCRSLHRRARAQSVTRRRRAAPTGWSRSTSWRSNPRRCAWRTAASRRPVVTTVDNIDFELDGFTTAKGSTLQFKLDSRFNQRGKIAASGPLTLEPLKADLRLDLRNVDLLPLQPYVLEQTKIAISRGNVTTQGRLNLQNGSARADPRALQRRRRRGQLRLGRPPERHRLPALAHPARGRHRCPARAVLARDQARRAGRLLHPPDPRRPGPASTCARSAASRVTPAAIRQPKAAAPVTVGSEANPMGEAALAAEGTRTAEVAPPSAPPPPIRIDRVEIKRGNVAFSDRFVRPNYDANLTDLAGTLTGFSTAADAIAKLDLTGKVDKSAPLSIAGEFNLFRQDSHLDIIAKVTDFELTGLSSYSGKYVGYGIAKGKLSAELNYKIEDRKLTATNQIFLDQLTFGDKVDSPDAVNLPVQLAVSLLKNSRGEIDLRLPVSGTLDDPEFSIFGLVLKMFFNLIGKAITSPVRAARLGARRQRRGAFAARAGPRAVRSPARPSRASSRRSPRRWSTGRRSSSTSSAVPIRRPISTACARSRSTTRCARRSSRR